MPPKRELKVGALSSQDWNYLRGLFLSDGISYVRHRGLGQVQEYWVKFFLQGNDKEIAQRVANALKKAGLNASIRKYRCTGNMITVAICSRSLFDFFPKKKLLRQDAVRRRFFTQYELFDSAEGIPFLAGLLDGDGYCQVSIQKYYFHSVRPWRWSLNQSSYPFLIDYIKKLVDSLVPNSVTIAVLPSGAREVCIHKSGIKSLLDAGIAKYSWKAIQWIRRMKEARSERLNYLDVGQVARMFNVSGYIVRRWLQTGQLNYRRQAVKTRKKEGLTLSRHYIPASELEKFKRTFLPEFLREREKIRRIRDKGVTLMDLAKMLNVGPARLRYWCHRGDLAAASVRDQSGYRHLVIPKDQAKRFRSKFLKERRRFELVKREGVKLVDVAKMLSLSHKTLYKWYKHGKIRATMVRDGRDKFPIMPGDEVDQLKKCERKTDRG